MYRHTLLLLIVCLSCQVLPGQIKNYRTLLTDHQITQRLTYHCLIDKGFLTGDSTLVNITHFNTFGLPVREISSDPYHPYPAKTVYEYLHDTLRWKITHYAENEVALSENEYQYDSSGRMVQSFFRQRPAADSAFKQWTTHKLYDDQHRLVKEYEEGGKYNLPAIKYTYDKQGRLDRCYDNFSVPKASKWYRKMQYDSRNNRIKTYYYQGRKKRLVFKNVFNAQNQLVESYNFADSNYHICTEGIEYAVKKNDVFLTKNYYDKDGFLIRQTKLLRTIPIEQTVYRYISVETNKPGN